MSFFCPYCENLLTRYKKPKKQPTTRILSCDLCKKSYIVTDEGLEQLDNYQSSTKKVRKKGKKKGRKTKICPLCQIPLTYYRNHFVCFDCGYVRGFPNNDPTGVGNTWHEIMSKIYWMKENWGEFTKGREW